MKVGQILKVTGGRLISGDRKSEIDLGKISTDSRSIKRGEFFIALSGENFCGSRFLKDALKRGASGAIIEDAKFAMPVRKKVLIVVKDATKALQDIARTHRADFNIPIIAITGSNGKTTAKEMISAVLATKYSVLKNEGTRNNHIGVPLTLLKLNKRHDMCILEFGTNHRGEIKTLAQIAKPTMAVMTNIGPSHLEHLKDLGGVYKEKIDILRSLDKRGAAIVNGDDPFLSRIKSAKFKIYRYGFGPSNNVIATNIRSYGGRLVFKVGGKEEYSLKLLGTHNVLNALAAIAVAERFGISAMSIKKALSVFKPASMRLNALTVRGIPVMNDSYNSNPASMRMALEALKACRADCKWVVSGDMLELGSAARSLHRMTGKLVAGSDVSGLLAFGKYSGDILSGAHEGGMANNRLWHCSSHDQIANIIRKVAGPKDMVLIKGSRGMRMEKVIEILKG